ncbi:lamin tail domain-containing protein [Streptomyces triticiradicis]|uniref:Lamin tail domain-containing protein n=1 Tax=Streptomyces triticiradicis TaxID=2651189 RepID=A0A7J5DFR9_9ACTN|nr:lamin tail domain-containing protein [Streptomyces triticiradicis]KAB1987447.1 lamin tail domain-containing protein [Streptomyces triticiradicis]
MTVSTSARRLTAAALSAAAITAAIAVPASAADPRPYRQSVEISRVQYDSPGRDDRSNRSLNQEWVEITNNGRRSVNLDGWTLSDADGHTYTFDHYRLGGRSTVRVHTGVGRDSRTDLFQDRHAYVWNNDRDRAVLRNDHGRFVDASSWGRRHFHH